MVKRRRILTLSLLALAWLLALGPVAVYGSNEEIDAKRTSVVRLYIQLQDGGIDPVVGWLVCVEGPHKGNDFRLHSERNLLASPNLWTLS
ncbi:hypothetical protein [Paenibacillus sp. sgz302251]|uniref:hypothetical protein n=1 Tax=Paenibacillus sp. sgz302251 TaxID=3414493 RepID=UPI003C7B503F